MSSEVQRIPPAPRRVAWRRVFGYRWPLLAATFTLCIYGGVMTWMLWLAHSGRIEDQARLDNGPRVGVKAVIETADPLLGVDEPPRSEPQWVSYAFHADGHNWTGRGRTATAGYRPGYPIDVEYLAGEPRLNRIVGVPVSTRADILDPRDAFTFVVLPGLLLFLGWIAGVFHLRHILAHGDVGTAQVLAIRRVRYCLPETFAVRFSFKDHRARQIDGHHWVRIHSPLGARLLKMLRQEELDRVPVLHDRRFSQHCRLVLPEDFAPDPNPIDPMTAIRM